ncbi:LTA synthase family protein [Candidatus Woesearchaeota archaeon]|nr:LTA synthase family protein [Candidatus Woesearchaeota archaeon]
MKKIKLLTDKIRKGDPHLLKRVLRAGYENTLRAYFKIRGGPKFKVTDEQWDYLILLDACRYDEYCRNNTIKEGTLQSRLSSASDTEEWLMKNFNEPQDMIYVSANPKIMRAKGIKNKFFRVEHVWDYGWNTELDTVHPDKVSDAAIRLAKKYPNKKMIIHYLQPHVPYIGETKITFPQTVQNRSKCMSVFEINDKVMFEKYDINKIKQAYRDNLRLVMESVKKMLPRLHGKIVITADHGEAFGEKRLYFHPRGIYTKELTTVPWHVINNAKQDLLAGIRL